MNQWTTVGRQVDSRLAATALRTTLSAPAFVHSRRDKANNVRETELLVYVYHILTSPVCMYLQISYRCYLIQRTYPPWSPSERERTDYTVYRVLGT